MLAAHQVVVHFFLPTRKDQSLVQLIVSLHRVLPQFQQGLVPAARWPLPVVLAQRFLLAAQQNQPVVEAEGRVLVHRQLLGIVLVPLQLLIPHLLAKLQDASKNGQVLGLARKDLYVLVHLGSAGFGAAVEEVEALDCAEGEDGVLEVVAGERVRLRLELPRDDQQVVRVEVELIEQEAVRRAEFLDEQSLSAKRATSSKGGRKGLRTNSLFSLSFCLNLETSRNCIVISLASVAWDCSSSSDSRDACAFSTLRSIESLISWMRSTAGPRSRPKYLKPMKAESMKPATAAPLRMCSCVSELQAAEKRSLHQANDDIIKINHQNTILTLQFKES